MAEVSLSSLRGKWAQGIKPRHFTWILKDQIAVCERLGGRGSNHRPVRRQEEIVWVMNNNFDLTISLIPGQHNLAAYKDLGLAHRHWPVADNDEATVLLPRIYEQMGLALEANKRMLMHRRSLDDVTAGFMGGFLIWGGYMSGATDTIVMTERLFSRQVGPTGRSIITAIANSDKRKVTRDAERAAEAEAAANNPETADDSEADGAAADAD